MYRKLTVLASLLAVARAQQAGTLETETHPRITTQKCTRGGSCTTQQQSVVLDSNWRWLHTTSGYTNCYTGAEWDTSICTNGQTCASQCALEGAKYSETYGITTSGNALTLKFVTGKNIGSRVYLMASDTKYQMFKLKNQEFTFDVDMSNLGCGLNGALYMIEMDEDGGMAKHPSNKAGAKYGTGYCDAQCPHDIKFISGEANVEGWTPSETDPNAGSGNWGSCCPEMDIWEANSQATAYTPHPCYERGPYRCEGEQECGDGSYRYDSICDKDGCDFNSWRMGNREFLGRGAAGVDTSKKFTVVTQFITDTGTATGNLKEIKRIYVQDGRVIQNSNANFDGIPAINYLSNEFCEAQKTVFNDRNGFADRGGMAEMGASYDTGMVLALSVWADHAAHMLWLDSEYPLDRDPEAPGISRGPCPRDSGNPDDVVANAPNSSVTFSNIKWGDLDSTYTNSGGGSTTTRVTTTTTRGATTTTTRPTTTSTGGGGGGTVPKWGQCGGIGYSGPTQCVSGSTCTKLNDWYSQCL